MELSSDQKKKLMTHLNTKWENRPCHLCGENDWTVSESIFEMTEFLGENRSMTPGKIFPVVTVMCNDCGNTNLINPFVVGIIQNQQDDSGDEINE